MLNLATKWTRPNSGLACRPDANCVLWFPGQDDAYSTTIRDRSGKENHGTIVGATWSRQPSGLWSLYHDGDDYIDIDVAVNDLAATTTGTWMAWVKLPDATPASNTRVITFGDTDGSSRIEFFVTKEGLLRAGAWNADTVQWDVDTDAAVFSDNVFLHVALIQDGVSPILIVNGVQVAQTFTTSTNKTLWFSGLGGIDNGRIGCLNCNSLGNINYLTGYEALVTLTTDAKTVTQVRHRVNQTRHLFGV